MMEDRRAQHSRHARDEWTCPFVPDARQTDHQQNKGCFSLMSFDAVSFFVVCTQVGLGKGTLFIILRPSFSILGRV